MSRLHEAARLYAELGYRLFPCIGGTKNPLTKHGFLDASSDLDQIEEWWTQHPQANIGLATAGLLVLDIDVDDHANENRWLAERFEDEASLMIAPLSLTAHGGRQYLFRQPEGKHWRNTTGKLFEHVDTRADGGYIVLPPSVLEGKKRYRWTEGMELDVPPDQLPLPPAWLVQLLDGGDHQNPSPPATTNSGNQIPAGQRNATLFRLAGNMRRVGMIETEIDPAIRQANQRCTPPLPESEVQRIVQSVCRYPPSQVATALVEDHFEQMYQQQPEELFAGITSRELNTNEYTQNYLINGLLVEGQPGIIAGPKKTLKTNISIDLALSLAQGGWFLNRFTVQRPVRVGLMSGESGAATIQETARRIAKTKRQSLEDFENAVWCFAVPELKNRDHIQGLRDFISRHRLEVLILDPTYLMMLGLGDQAGNLFVVGEYLKTLSEITQETGCMPILCHHLKKSIADPYEPAELENIAWAGFQEFVRQWLLINRRVKYDPDQGGHHELWLSVGGSAGHSGLWGVNIDEGTSQDEAGRYWDVELKNPAELREQEQVERSVMRERKQRAKALEQIEQDQESILGVLRKQPEGETQRELRERCGLSLKRFEAAFSDLVERHAVTPCSVAKGNRQSYPGFRLSEQPVGLGGENHSESH